MQFSINVFLLSLNFQVDVITGRQYTFAELRDSSAALAVRFQTKFKLVKGDVVAICLPNLPEYPGAVLGAIEAGLTVTTVNPIYTAGKKKKNKKLSKIKKITQNFSKQTKFYIKIKLNLKFCKL